MPTFVSFIVGADVCKIYGQVNRLVQPLVSSQVAGGYAVHGSAVSLPPNAYTYSDTGMFLDPTTRMLP